MHVASRLSVSSTLQLTTYTILENDSLSVNNTNYIR